MRCCAFLGLVILIGSCANETVPLSAEQTPATEEHSLDTVEANDESPPEEVVVAEIPAPQEWPTCWLSARLSTAAAMLAVDNGWDNSRFTPARGRTEFVGKAANPTNRGNCVFNWFGQDNPEEPWVALLHNRLSPQPDHVRFKDNYRAVVTCTADSTPDCTCMTTIPKVLDASLPFLVGDCVRADDIGGHVLYSVDDPQRNGSPRAAGRCDTATGMLTNLLSTKKAEVLSMTDDGDVHIDAANACHIDVAPFNPRDDERDWYGDAIRDWAVAICEDEEQACRSYAIFYKSNREEDLRSPVSEVGLLLLCRNGTCQRVH